MPPEAYLHSEVKEIMVTKPSFALKWGNVIISGLVLVIIAFASWFKYPEFITTAVSLSALGKVSLVQAPATNHGAMLLVRNDAVVRAGTPLVAWLDAEGTDYHEAGKLRVLLHALSSAGQTPIDLSRELTAIRPGRLGRLLPVYQSLRAGRYRSTNLSAAALTADQLQVSRWDAEFVARAPQEGVVRASYPLWLPKAPIPSLQTVLCLLPRQERYLASGDVSREQYAVVRQGQPVSLQIHELGATVLTGRVVGVAPLARHDRHQVFIEVDPSTRLHLNPSFAGNAKIVLPQQSLLTKLLLSKG